MSDFNYIQYSELKKFLVIKEENKSKFREQTEIENIKLKESLLYHKKVLSPLVVAQTILGLELIDGHHRWDCLSSIIEECEDFNTSIPVLTIKRSDTAEEMLRIQLGRRNLSNGEICKYVDVLANEKNLTKKEAIKQTAQDLNTSVNKITNAVYPEREKQIKSSYQDNKNNPPSHSNQIVSVSNSTPNVSNLDDLEKDNNNPSTPILPKVKDIKIKTLVAQDRTPEEIEELVKTRRLPNELNRLLFIEDNIAELKADLDKFKDTDIYNEMKALIEKYYLRLNYLNKN